MNSAERMQSIEHLLNTRAHIFEPANGLMTLVNAFGVYSELFLGRLQLEAPVLDKIMDLCYFVNVGRSVETRAMRVAVRLDHREFAFPEAQCGGRDGKQLGHF